MAADFQLSIAEFEADARRVVLPAVQGIGGAKDCQHLPHGPPGVAGAQDIIVAHLRHRPAVMAGQVCQAPAFQIAQGQQLVDQQHLAAHLRVPSVAHRTADVMYECAKPKHPAIKPTQGVIPAGQPKELIGKAEYPGFMANALKPAMHPPGQRSFFCGIGR